MKADEPLEPPGPEIDRVIHAIDEKQKDLDYLSEVLGATKEQLVAAKPLMIGLYEAARGNSELRSVLASGVDAFRSTIPLIGGLGPVLRPVQASVPNIAGTIDAVLASTDSAVYGLPEVYMEYKYNPNPFLTGEDADTISSGLAKLDAAASGAHKGAWAEYYSSKPDKGRAALLLMRQVFDQFFAALAPDEMVRASPHWHPKEPPRTQQIHRRERIEYAAAMHVKDPNVSASLAADASHMLEVYQVLNSAHDRGPMSSEKASQALLAMDAILAQWLAAID